MSEKSNMSSDVAKIVLVPHERSHPFARRECVVREPLKVGRSVDKKRISANNLIFDCRVLSRNHAVIWFENGKFYIKDTKSSNGTFVNESRLSPSGEESGPVELKSRDILQFGVNVNVERRVTHGCIIATIRLYVNDMELPGLDPPVHEVLQIVQLALSREQELENKLASMQEVLNTSRQLATESMISVVKEDELMSRLEMLENQLQVYSRNSSDDELKKQLALSFEEKLKTEASLKESLRKILQEKLECVSKLNQIERDYDKAEQECQRYKTLYDAAKEEHSQEKAKLSEQLRSAESERKALEDKLKEERQNLSTKNEALQAELDFTSNQLSSKKSQVEELKDELVQLQLKLQAELQKRSGLESTSSQGDSVGFPPLESSEEGLGDTFHSTQQEGLTPEEPKQEEVQRSREVAKNELKPVEGGRVPSFISESDSDMEEDEAEKLAERVLILEADLRRSEETIQSLQQELALTKLAQTPTTDTGRYQLGQEPGKGMHMVGRQRSMEEVATIVSETAIAKGQIEVLRNSVAESEAQLKVLTEELALESEKSQALQETISVLTGQLNHCYVELQLKQEEIKSVRVSRRQEGGDTSSMFHELSSLKQRMRSEQEERERLKAQNEDLHMEVERLQLEVQSGGSPTKTHFLARPGSPTAEDQKVKLLTFIALVSIGVALASWLT